MINPNDEIGDVDAIIIPGTRNSTKDAKELFDSGLTSKIIAKSEKSQLLELWRISNPWKYNL